MKKVAIILLIAMVVLGLAAGFLWWLGGSPNQNELSPNSGFKKIERPDTDQDGLADWEEEQWQTNKSLADTDGDGVGDGAELAIQSDPRSRGSKLTDPEDRLRALVRNAMAAKDQPLSVPGTALPALLSYTSADLHLEAAETAALLTRYASDLRQSLATFIAAKLGQEPVYLLTYLREGNPNALTQINAATKNYFSLVYRLSNQSVPASAATLHLELTNRATHLAELVFLMSQVDKEPLIATRAAQDHAVKLVEFLDFLKQFDAYFAERQIK